MEGVIFIAAVVLVIAVVIILAAFRRSYKRKPGPASVARLEATVDMALAPSRLAEKEARKIVTKAKRAGHDSEADYDDLGDVFRAEADEINRVMSSQLPKHHGYTPPVKKNGEHREGTSSGHGSEM